MLLRLGQTTGTIRIDGYDISKLKLKDLRKSISVIPQVRNFGFGYNFMCSVNFTGGNTAQKMKFSIKDFFSKCEEILNP